MPFCLLHCALTIQCCENALLFTALAKTLVWLFDCFCCDLVLTCVCPLLMQVRSWAWAMYRRSWTAYPAGRLTQTCPMPTTPQPPTARTHEDQHTSPCSFSLPRLHLKHLPPPLSSLPTLSPSTPSQRCGVKEGCRGKGGVGTQFSLPHRLSLSLLQEKSSPSLPHLILLPSLSSLLGCCAEGKYLSLLHTRLSVTWE